MSSAMQHQQETLLVYLLSFSFRLSFFFLCVCVCVCGYACRTPALLPSRAVDRFLCDTATLWKVYSPHGHCPARTLPHSHFDSPERARSPPCRNRPSPGGTSTSPAWHTARPATRSPRASPPAAPRPTSFSRSTCGR